MSNTPVDCFDSDGNGDHVRLNWRLPWRIGYIGEPVRASPVKLTGCLDHNDSSTDTSGNSDSYNEAYADHAVIVFV